tara:strand:- start:2704 stop:3084 length:381 start_codon:yes stop_codon:yes gene_type:complete
MSRLIEKNLKFTKDEVSSFAEISGDKNKIHLSEEYAASTFFKKPIVHGLFVVSKLSAIIAENYINPILISMNYEFKKPIYVGDEAKFVIQCNTNEEVKTSSFKIMNTAGHECVSGTFKTKEKLNKG